MSAMFSNSRSNQGVSSGHLAEFKAGRSFLHPGSTSSKKKVVAEKAKGLVFIKQSSDQLIHFCWKNRETGAVVDDLIIFPGDTEFKEVKGCPDGKVYILKFKSSDERRLFWIQDGNSDADKDLCQKVNDALNKPPTARASARGGSSERSTAAAAAANLAGLSGSELQELGTLGGLDQQQLMQLLQFMNHGGSDASTLLPQLPPSSDRNGGAGNELSHLQSLLGGLRSPGNSQNQTSIDLSDVITGEKVVETVRNNESRLVGHLPDNEGNSRQELEETVRTPQFRQASDAFGHALQTGQMAPVLEQFGLSEEARKAAASGDLLEFAKKLTASEQGVPASVVEASEESVKEPEPKRGKTDDDEMDLD